MGAHFVGCANNVKAVGKRKRN